MTDDINRIEIYVHIPFCVKKCNYCDFLSFASDDITKDRYTEALSRQIAGEAEIMKYADCSDMKVSSIYFGGGTPTTLSGEKLGELLNVIKQNYTLAGDCEITIEVNPGTVDYDKLKCLRDSGFNRLSIGLQSADDKELAMLGRIHTYDQFLDTYNNARQAGFCNISVDIMTALPGQDRADLENTLRKVTELGPEHISTYSLIIEEGTPFYDKYGSIDGPVAGEKLERELYWACCDFLEESGYKHYEISNFARDGFESRHNCGYWRRRSYLGFGLGASSLVKNKRVTSDGIHPEYRLKNTSSMEKYLADPFGRDEVEKLEREDIIEEYMFLGLRMNSGIEYSDFEAEFGLRAEDIYKDVISKLAGQELIVETGEGIRLSKKGIDYGNYVFSEFTD